MSFTDGPAVSFRGWSARRRSLSVSLIGVALAAALAACSSSGGGSGTPPTNAQLGKTMITSADLPSGWSSAPHDRKGDAGDAATQAKLAKCIGAKNTTSDRVSKVFSANFTKGGVTIASSASSFKKASDVDSDVAMLHSTKIDNCYQSLLRAAVTPTLPSGVTLGSIKIAVMPSSGGPSNQVATAKATVTVGAQGKQVPVYVQIAFIRGRLTEAQVQAESLGAPIPASLMNSVVQKFAGRINKL